MSAPNESIVVSVDSVYSLSFALSPDGEVEFEGMPTTIDGAVCVEARGDYLCFETDQEVLEFFRHDCEAHRGQWWDEERLCRLIGAVEH